MAEKRIMLVPVDFSEVSDKALRQAHTLSKALGKRLVLLYVIEDKGGWFSFFSGEQQKVAREQIEAKLEALKARAEKFSGNETSWIISEGKPYVKILEKAKELNAAFIVMGARGEVTDESEKNYVGTNASKVARSAPCPVITVNSKITCHNLRTILLPLDLTRETRQKVTQAIELATRFNARIKVMSALWSVGDQVVISELQTIIHQVVSFIRNAGIECTGEIVESSSNARSAVPIILKYADEQGDIDMILIMTQPELGVLEYFISSNAHEMLKHSPYPVMSVQPKELERTSIGF
ncbi:MAG TPA: universal stress protein [Bacteroidales bacterium]|nr:universal stress protein [Bacteroidales bacterium]HRZ48846.1 universal stress protein [Bacteroidales bacterium]